MIKTPNGCYFACDECPMLPKENLDLRLELEKEYGDFQFDHLGCDKIDYDFFAGGYCEDAFCELAPAKKNGVRRSDEKHRRIMDKKKKKRRMKLAASRFGGRGAGYVSCDFVEGKFVPVGNHVKLPKSSRLQRFYKRYSNRILRHGGDMGSGKSGYKRCFDYKWELD